jgi:Secretion system C-terminal sorting domain/Fibronectin type III domain
MFTKQIILPISWLRFVVFALMVFAFGQAAHAQGCSQPSNLNSTVLPAGTVVLTWSAPGGALNYSVQYRVGNAGIWLNGGTVTTTSQVLTGLAPETVYTWRVRANCSTFSSVATFNSGGGVGSNTSCSQPSNQLANVTSPTTATLSWSGTEGALYYTVQYRLNNSGAWINAGSVMNLSINIANLAVNSEYGWRVKASCSVYSSVALFNTGASGNGGNTTCSQPSNLDAFPLSNTSVELSWSAIQEAQNYTVQYRLGLAGAWITLLPTTATSLILSGLQAGSEYSWRVKASCSDYSSQAVFTTGGGSTGGGNTGGGATSCSAPSNTNTLSVLPTSAVVEWEANPDALNYTVQYRLENGGAYVTVGTFTAATATITGLIPNRQYLWRVKANCSPYGSDVQFQTPSSSVTINNNGAIIEKIKTGKKSAASLQVFPNPAMTDMVYVQTDLQGARLRIMNQTGRIISDLALTEDQQEINIAQWSNGVYFLQLMQNDGMIQTSKLVVTH